MAAVSINTNPGRRELAVFGAVLPVTFALAGFMVARWTGSSAAPAIVWGTGGVLTVVYLVARPLRRAIFVGFGYAAYPIGWVVSHLVLLIVFALVVTPIALLLRLLGKDPLGRRIDPSATSYWTPREARADVRRYFQQF